ncbi:MAG: DUF2933 domain-containing protein [Anaerolinea sp.]|nr:DUF2933 domain-containing protein [Anaerolinea sp.]
MKRKHWFLMIVGCALPIIVLTAVFVWQLQFSSVLLWGIVLLCPLVHLLMMRDHLGHGHEDSRSHET